MMQLHTFQSQPIRYCIVDTDIGIRSLIYHTVGSHLIATMKYGKSNTNEITAMQDRFLSTVEPLYESAIFQSNPELFI